MPDYVIDVDPAHRVFRIPIRKVVTDQVVFDAYRSVKRLAAQGGPYTTLADCSQVEDLKLTAETVRSLALGVPVVPAGRPRASGRQQQQPDKAGSVGVRLHSPKDSR
jgi:hypothetical protein